MIASRRSCRVRKSTVNAIVGTAASSMPAAATESLGELLADDLLDRVGGRHPVPGLLRTRLVRRLSRAVSWDLPVHPGSPPGAHRGLSS